MIRYSGIAVSVVGVLVAGISIARIIPNLTGTGFSLLVLGLALIGLSFIPMPANEEGIEPMPVWERLTKIFFAPTEVFANLRRNPRWFWALLVIAIAGSIYSFAFFNKIGDEKIVGYTIDKTKEISFMDERAKKQIEDGREDAIKQSKNIVLKIGNYVNGFVGQFILLCILATLFFICCLAMGGSINWWQAFSASVYGLLPSSLIQRLLSLILLYVKDPDDIHPILGQNTLVQDNLSFLVSSADSPALYSLLAGLSLLWFYWIWLTATGLKNTGERVSSTVAWTSTLMVWGVFLTISVVMALLFPSFMG